MSATRRSSGYVRKDSAASAVLPRELSEQRRGAEVAVHGRGHRETDRWVVGTLAGEEQTGGGFGARGEDPGRLRGLDGDGEVGLAPRVHSAAAVECAGGRGREVRHGNRCDAGVRLDTTAELEAVQIGQADIEKCRVRHGA
ncbi:hypothetical protein GCM10009612_44280 [Streptomyces beijiangensis]